MTRYLRCWIILIGLALASSAWATACLPSTTYNVTGTRIRYVSTTGGGFACSVGTPCTFAQALSTLTAGDTIILSAGTYQLNLFTQNGIFINAVNNVTIRGVDATSCDTTILDGNGMNNTPSGSNPSGAADGVNYGIWSDSVNTTIAHLTISNIYTHPINFNEGAATPVIHQVRIQNAGEQAFKINPPGLLATPGITGGIIEDTLMEYTAGPPTVDHGGGIGYWNAISAHRAINWTLRRSWFLGFHNADGVGAQYQPSILLWNCSTGWIIEQNTFLNNDNAIGVGLLNPVPSGCGTYDASNTTVRNNVVVQTTGFFTGTRATNSDGQINVWNANNTKVYHNTILNHGSSTHAVQIRWATTPASDIQNNLADDTIHLRDSANATSNGNYLSAVDAWFVAPQSADVHLNNVAGTQANVINQAPTLAAVTNDRYGVSRPQGAGYDRGAVEFADTAFDFALSLNTTAPIIGRGLSVAVTLTATASGGPAELVSWSSSGSGAGTTVGFGPACTATCPVTVTIQTRTSSALGLDTLMLVGTSATRERTITLDLTVLQTVGPTCTILWNAVTTNEDSSPITDLDHYNLYRRTSGAYGSPAVVTTPPTVQTTCSAAGLTTPGVHYLQVTAVDTGSVHESGASAELGLWYSTTAVGGGSAVHMHHHRQQQ